MASPKKNKSKNETPLMVQYNAIKSRHRDAVLFFRMGDFYEMFFEDAKTGSQVLGITLTSRSHGKSSKIPLAGVPWHAADAYLARLIKAGYKVAICEQVEESSQAKGIVKRDVVRVVTPGTTVSERVLTGDQNNYLLALHQKNGLSGIAIVDISTGEFELEEISGSGFADELQRLMPAEVLVPSETKEILGTETHVRFETASDLISGIELTTNGQKVAWSIADYLASLQKSVDELLKEKENAAVKATSGAEAKTESEPDAEPQESQPGTKSR